jgi:hypothetical protein
MTNNENTAEDTVQKKELTAADFLAYLKLHSKIVNCHIIDSVDIKASYVPKGKKLHMINCDFQEEFFLTTNEAIKFVSFQGCNFRKRVIIVNCTLESMMLSKTVFRQYFSFKNLTTKHLEIDSCKIESRKELRLQEFTTEKLTIKNNEAENDIFIKPYSAGTIWLEGSEQKHTLTLAGPTDERVFNEVRLFCNSNLRTDVILFNFKTEIFHLVGELKDSLIFAKNLDVNVGILDHFFNEGNVKVANLKPHRENSRLVLKKSGLGKAQLINSDFSKFQTVNLQDSSILEIIPVNVTLCTDKNLDANSLFATKENYRQLKIISQKNEDIDNKLMYARHEMKTLLAISQSTKGKFSDKFVLYTSWLSNDFGNDWSRALIWLISTSLVWYFLIKILLGYTYFEAALIWDEFGKFLIFLNPLHQFEKLFGIDPTEINTNGAILFDSIAKILGAYFLYQFVSAFRKFAKK